MRFGVTWALEVVALQPFAAQAVRDPTGRHADLRHLACSIGGLEI